MRNLREVLAPWGIDTEIGLVNELQLDSRRVQRGDVFVAIKGHQLDGGQFAEQAIAQGASAVIADSRCELNCDDERIIVIERLSLRLSELAASFYGQPSHAFDLVGVTGTNGKSSTTAMIATLAQHCQRPSAIIGTLGWGELDNLNELANTTPSSVELQQIFAQLKEQQKQLVAMEVSSHGLIQGRVANSRFKAAVFTNLSRDHLDYHGDMQSYGDAKLILMRDCDAELVVLNQDDAVAQTWLEKYEFPELVVYGRKTLPPTHGRYLYFSKVEFLPHGLKAHIDSSWGEGEVTLPLFGEFNLYNLGAALATLLGLGYPLGQLLTACKHLQPIAGRMQAYSAANGPTCVVDYAHTPDAIELALQALHQHAHGKVICVFGCGGDRDKGKRPLMAKAAQKYADRIVVTSDNPRSEDPQAILDDIRAGFSANLDVQYEIDRVKAIALAITQAQPGDIVLIAGKGHEDYQIIGDQVLPFCDRTLVQQLLAQGARS
ncbi:UDP-N-acetylmuramoyl-L-alanyl-D-glutamate--2,6-diaminopimelate ligase [Pseudoalteromonas sp. YIC-827]|uniref:UDP-N-acetylmuramoyl-L-alanyl-D-glutamate--2,6-diaminopimelate ligase n=1 Tax=Pseudoalteromonas qingdaonensis TaxID=3131913 RepID=A0ABU9N2M0_9GAMM